LGAVVVGAVAVVVLGVVETGVVELAAVPVELLVTNCVSAVSRAENSFSPP
jgi:hypothetical protein